MRSFCGRKTMTTDHLLTMPRTAFHPRAPLRRHSNDHRFLFPTLAIILIGFVGVLIYRIYRELVSGLNASIKGFAASLETHDRTDLRRKWWNSPIGSWRSLRNKRAPHGSSSQCYVTDRSLSDEITAVARLIGRRLSN